MGEARHKLFGILIKVCVDDLVVTTNHAGVDPGGGGGALGAEAPPPPPFIFRLYLINMLSIIMKFCLSIII